MGKSQRVKGHSWEREVAQRIREIDPNSKRQLEYQEGMGIDIATTLPLAIQCKAMMRPNFLQAFKEAKNSVKVKNGAHPVVAAKADHKGNYMLFDFEFALELLKKYFN